MIDLVVITAAIGATTSAVNLFDKIADQIERFITGQPETSVPKKHRLKFEKSGDDIIITSPDREIQRITALELANLPTNLLRYVRVLEQSMENHYAVWSQVYPQLAFMDSPVQKDKVEQQLRDIVTGMKSDLNEICRSSMIAACNSMVITCISETLSYR